MKAPKGKAALSRPSQSSAGVSEIVAAGATCVNIAAADQAEEIINEGVEQFLRHQRALSAVETVKAYRQKAEHMRDAELQKALRSLQTGANPEQVLQQLARNLTNKLIHSPTAVLKEASASSRHHVLQVAQELFELSVNPVAENSSDASEPQ